MTMPPAAIPLPRAEPRAADVCLIVEGCYPHVPGGVSSWVDWLMRAQKDHTFTVVSIVTGDEPRTPRYKFPDNMIGHRELVLTRRRRPTPVRSVSRGAAADVGPTLAKTLVALTSGGGLADFTRLVALADRLTLDDLLESRLSMELVRSMYAEVMPQASFLQYFWAWRALFGGLFATLRFDIPRAGAYHAISTGYAGLLAARASLVTGRPAVVTEHGIYTNERRIEILMADWISDSIEKGVALDDPRCDMRDLWIGTFEAYARVCYQGSVAITTLFRDNQPSQLASGADAGRLRVIPNGIEFERFASLPVATQDATPTLALIGRVVPIKDVKTFIAMAARVRARIPNLRALVMGPTEEDRAYHEECRELVERLGLADCVAFTGSVRITDYLPSIHVVVLTSLSEAQPLVLLEAGAAGIPCVATDVGACREILEGDGSDEQRGGFVTALVAPDELAERVGDLLKDEALRRRCGETLRQRVREQYASAMASRAYGDLYAEMLAKPDQALDPPREARSWPA